MAHVLVPVKRFDTAKTRLAGLLTPAERAELMRVLVQASLDAIRGARGVTAVTLVSGEPLAAGLGAEVWPDPGLPWNDALAAAAAEVVRGDHVAFVSADCPLLAAADVDALLDATPERGIAVARALDAGTNAVAMRPAAALPTHFGAPGSAEVHRAAAAAAGFDAVVVDRPGLALDLDGPDDVERFLSAGVDNAAARLLRPIFDRGRVMT